MYDPENMSKKTASDAHLSTLENPTAAFPIGSLAHLGDQSWSPPRPRAREPQPELPPEEEEEELLEDEEPTEETSWVEAETGVHPMLLVLSLLGGGLLAFAVVGVVGVFVLYYS